MGLMAMSAASARAAAVARHGGVSQALASGDLPPIATLTTAEALVLGLLRLDVRTYFVVLGHGTTELGEALRVHAAAGTVRVIPCRSEIEASHAATALRWVAGEQCAVVTSIGPGALQAAAASLAAHSDGIGVWHLYGDETTHDEGPNMQQVPGGGQHAFLHLLSALGPTQVLHTAQALPSMLRRGATVTAHPYRSKPFHVLLPINVQPVALVDFRLDRLPEPRQMRVGAAAPGEGYPAVARLLREAPRVVIKVGAGARGCGDLLAEVADLIDATIVMSPSSLGIVPDSHPRQMAVGGSKGSPSGNHAMEQARTLVVVGSRAVCQSDCSRTGYPAVTQVVNLNADPEDVTHYNRTTTLLGDVRATLVELIAALRALADDAPASPAPPADDEWLTECQRQRHAWDVRRDRLTHAAPVHDPVWGRAVLTQPVAVRVALDWVQRHGHVAFFDAGDVQANGFQLARVEREGWFFTESGASYMGFATSAVLAGGVARTPFHGVALTGDGSFVMSPQVLIDAVHTGTRGTIIIFDNRRMSAISALQVDQYGTDFATSDGVPVDYVAWARAVQGVHGVFGGFTEAELEAALEQAHRNPGLTVVHVPVYFGPDPDGGMGAHGRWNVGSWVEDTQALIERTVI